MTMISLIMLLSGTGFGLIIGMAIGVSVRPSRTASVQHVCQCGDSVDLRARDIFEQGSRK